MERPSLRQSVPCRLQTASHRCTWRCTTGLVTWCCCFSAVLVVFVVIALQKSNTVDRVHPHPSYPQQPHRPSLNLRLFSPAEQETSVPVPVAATSHQLDRRTDLGRKQPVGSPATSHDTAARIVEHQNGSQLRYSRLMEGRDADSGVTSPAAVDVDVDVDAVSRFEILRTTGAMDSVGQHTQGCKDCSKVQEAPASLQSVPTVTPHWQVLHGGSRSFLTEAPNRVHRGSWFESKVLAVQWKQWYMVKSAQRLLERVLRPAANLVARASTEMQRPCLRSTHQDAASIWQVVMARISTCFGAASVVVACATCCTITSLLLCVAVVSLFNENLARYFVTVTLSGCGQVCARMTAAGVSWIPAQWSGVVAPHLHNPLLVGPLIYASLTFATWVAHLTATSAFCHWSKNVSEGAAYALGAACCVLFAAYCCALLTLGCFGCAAGVTVFAMVALVLGFHASDETGDSALEATSEEIDPGSCGASGSTVESVPLSARYTETR